MEAQNKYEATFETWNNIAALYEERFMDLTIYNDTYDFFCQHIFTDQPRILEVGCGPGNISKYILAKRPDIELTAIDISPSMVALAQKNTTSGDFLVMDGRYISQLNKSFDGIISGFHMPYMDAGDVNAFLVDCHALLNLHGVIYVSFVDGPYINSSLVRSSSGDSMLFYYYTEQDITATLKTIGFDIIYVWHIDYERSDGSKEMHVVLLGKRC